MVRKIRELNGEPVKRKKPVKGKKPVIIVVILILIIIFGSQLLYFYVIPRVTLDLKTAYHEATGGAGTGGLININSKYINSGTVDIKNLQIKASILNSTKTLLTNETYEQGILSPGASHELKLVTNGNCFETFYIIIEVEFATTDESYYERFTYKTHEDAMNIGFEDSIFDWGF